MHTPLPYSLVLLLLLPLLSSTLSTLSHADANNERLNSLSIDLTGASPLNNNSIDLRDKTIEADITPMEYTYLMAITLKGASPEDHDQHILAVPDTGSHFIWLKNCKSNDADITTTTTSTSSSSSCIQEKPAAKQVLKCDSRLCEILKKIDVEPLCSIRKSENCLYNARYGDGFTCTGELTTHNKLSFPIFKNNVVSGKDEDFFIKFGLSTEWEGRFEDSSAGIVGLGKGELSLFKQISTRYKIPYKFSYCLPQYYDHHHNSRTRSHGKLIFGNLVTVTPENSITLDRMGSPLLYSVHLQSIFVGDHEIEAKEGGITKMVIDTGTTFTFLADHDLFTEFLSKVEEKVGKDSIDTEHYDHCYKEENAKGLEKISLQIGGEKEEGKGIELKRENFFDVYKIEKENNIEEYLCLTVVDGTKKKHEMRVRRRGENNGEIFHLLGSRAQMDFRVAFDITGENHKVSFDKQEKCGKDEEESMVFQE